VQFLLPIIKLEINSWFGDDISHHLLAISIVDLLQYQLCELLHAMQTYAVSSEVKLDLR
jgi:hypothetical protein